MMTELHQQIGRKNVRAVMKDSDRTIEK